MIEPAYGHYALSPWRQYLLALAQRQPPGWLGRRLALMLRRLLLWGRGGQPIDASSEGLRLRVHVGDNVSERKFLFMPQFFDRAERDYLVGQLRADGCFIDIGANAGVYTLTAARAYRRLGGSGQVLAVEANPQMLARLATNIELNGLDGQVRIAGVALADHDGEIDFNLAPGNLGESGLAPTGGRCLRLPCRTLFGLLQDQGVERLDGLKIDVEGMEDRVLLPFFAAAPPTLHPGFIIIEDSSARWGGDLLGELAAQGYQVAGRYRMNLLLSRTPGP